MRGGVGRVVVRAQVGFGFDDVAGQKVGAGAMHEYLAEEARSYQLGRGLKEGARQQMAASL
jgi:hypothetical protein